MPKSWPREMYVKQTCHSKVMASCKCQIQCASCALFVNMYLFCQTYVQCSSQIEVLWSLFLNYHSPVNMSTGKHVFIDLDCLHWILFDGVFLMVNQYRFRYWLVIFQVTSHCRTQYDLAKWCKLSLQAISGLILGLLPGNEKRRYKVTPSLIGSALT